MYIFASVALGCFAGNVHADSFSVNLLCAIRVGKVCSMNTFLVLFMRSRSTVALFLVVAFVIHLAELPSASTKHRQQRNKETQDVNAGQVTTKDKCLVPGSRDCRMADKQS